MQKLRVPIIVAGEIRWIETEPRQEARTSHPSRSGSALAVCSSALNDGCRCARNNLRALLIVLALLVAVGASFIVLQYLGPRWSPLLLSLAGIVAIFSCLGKRRAGSLSAYSIFNEGAERLPGQLSADDIEREIRGGGMAGPNQNLQPPPPVGGGVRLGGAGRRQAAAQADDIDDDDNGYEGVGAGRAEYGDDAEDRCELARACRTNAARMALVEAPPDALPPHRELQEVLRRSLEER